MEYLKDFSDVVYKTMTARFTAYRRMKRNRDASKVAESFFSASIIAISFDLDDLLEHCEAYMFNITNVNKHRSPRDMKVRDTVIAIIDNFFETNEFALLYICETGDRKQALRNRLFDSWFAYANGKEQYVIMVANIQDLEGVNNYAAMILRKDNPNFVDYGQVLNRSAKIFFGHVLHSEKPGFDRRRKEDHVRPKTIKRV